MSKHPHARDPQHRSALTRATKDVDDNFGRLESLKPRINERYERFGQLVGTQSAELTSKSSCASADPAQAGQNGEKRQRNDIADPRVTESLHAAEHKDLAVKLAGIETRRRAILRKATRQAGIPENIEQERRAAGLWGDWEKQLVEDHSDHDALSRQMQGVRSRTDDPNEDEIQDSDPGTAQTDQRIEYHYPALHQNSHTRLEPGPIESVTSTRSYPSSLQFRQQPDVPPNDPSFAACAPSRPTKEALPLPAADPVSLSARLGARNEELEASAMFFKPSAYSENGSPLRTVFLPPDLRRRFLVIAQSNTQANLETCGIICGTLISNALFVSKLVIPEQKSTSDTCETIEESRLFDYVDGEDLIVLGWIHTHPTQTCFMSSRDLHTHGGYQVMMPESIAIVCAPSKGEWGVFRLTDPPGIRTIMNCTQTGLFHPHTASDMYTDALRPGHVFEVKGLELEVVDLRSG